MKRWFGRRKKTIPSTRPTPTRRDDRTAGTERQCHFETMEPRIVLSANPVVVGAVYIEDDSGTDSLADHFYIAFEGGTAKTRLTRVVIDTSQDGNPQTLGEPDVYFDTRDPLAGNQSLGSGGFHAFKYSSQSVGVSADQVSWKVDQGGTRLTIDLLGFKAGDRLVFSIDVDQYFANKPDDQITSGIEFAGSKLRTTFADDNYLFVHSSASTNGVFRYAFPFGADDVEDSGLLSQLPSHQNRLNANNLQSIENRTAGALDQFDLTPKPISVSGTVFHDRDLDLVQDATDEGIAGVTLRLQKKDAGGAYVDVPSGGKSFTQTKTDANGDYRFDVSLNLMPGTYRVVETQPDDFEYSVGEIPGTVEGKTIGRNDPDAYNVLGEIEIPLGDQHAVDYDFAEAKAAQICGFVYHDRNNNGIKEAGEEGLAGVQLKIVPVRTIVDQSAIIVTTNAQGRYCATGLAPGEYEIIEMATPVGYLDGIDTPGKVDGVTRGIAINPGDHLKAIKLNSGSAGDYYNFGEIQLASVEGYVFLGTSEGDCVGPGHPEYRAIAGVEVRLTDQNGKTWSAVTDQNGRYQFTDLAPGTYAVVEITHPDFPYLQGDVHVGRIGGQNIGKVTATDTISGIELQPGDRGTGYNFCEHEPASLSGNVFHDRNNDGVRAVGDEGIGQVLIRLYNDQGELIRSTRTDATGHYHFGGLYAGSYRIVEVQPAGFVDGIDTAGTINGQTVGLVAAGGDRINGIDLLGGQKGIDYNFGEYRLGSIAGTVFTDINGDCLRNHPGESPIGNVTLQLLDDNGKVLATTRTDAQGRYRFDLLSPGGYSVRQLQPQDYFQGGQVIGVHLGSGLLGTGDAGTRNLISAIGISSDTHLVEYNFCEVPPATISGYVYQDGTPIFTKDGEVPDPQSLLKQRNGRLTPDDTRLSGVVIELRDGITGLPVTADRALSGRYGAGPIRTVTDANGYYEFTGLVAGSYAVFEVHPVGFVDHVDFAGTTDGIPFNPLSHIDPLILSTLDQSVRPGHDAIIRIAVGAGDTSEMNNFSEVVVRQLLPPPPLDTDPPAAERPFLTGFVPPPEHTYAAHLPVRTLEIPAYGSAGAIEYTWHLSVIDGGISRGENATLYTLDDSVHSIAFLASNRWDEGDLDQGRWLISVTDPEQSDDDPEIQEYQFGLANGIPVVGDFNGDGVDEMAVYQAGHWFVDLNGNGQWDHLDLWSRLGDETDRPVTGDWDGDGKDDIGIFGPIWPGDARAMENEPGLPDPDNRPVARAKNVPPTADEATSGRRIMRLTAHGDDQADLIDHVFSYGAPVDVPIAGDWNGDGIRGIGVFNGGTWKLDLDGDGRWTARDQSVQFGESGDLPIVGDFNGDGIEDIGVFREGIWILDTNGNRELDAHDAVFRMGEAGDQPLAGDFDGDGIDEPIVYRGVSRE